MLYPEEQLHQQFYDKFESAMSEYMFLALTEDCHPLIDRCEQIVCASMNIDHTRYNDGECDAEDEVRHESHLMASRVMTKMLMKFAETY